MAKYTVFWAKGDYDDRQRAANAENCICYAEQHFNAIWDDNPDTTSENYTMCIIAHNASENSRAWSDLYCKKVSDAFSTKDAGTLKVAYKATGDFNLRYTDMPAILLEPFFVSDKTQAGWAASEGGQRKLAIALVESIKERFPDGGKVAFSVGHKYKTSNPHDRGAAVYGRTDIAEADLAEEVLILAAELITEDSEVEPELPACNFCTELEEIKEDLAALHDRLASLHDSCDC